MPAGQPFLALLPGTLSNYPPKQYTNCEIDVHSQYTNCATQHAQYTNYEIEFHTQYNVCGGDSG
jgi:hypothetical protein